MCHSQPFKNQSLFRKAYGGYLRLSRPGYLRLSSLSSCRTVISDSRARFRGLQQGWAWDGFSHPIPDASHIPRGWPIVIRPTPTQFTLKNDRHPTPSHENVQFGWYFSVISRNFDLLEAIFTYLGAKNSLPKFVYGTPLFHKIF